MRQPYVVPRHRLLLAAWLTALALPILVIDNIPKTEARAQASVETVAPADAAPTTSAPATTAPPTSAAPTTAAPTTQAPATTAPARKAAAKLASPTTTTAKPRPTTTTTAPAPANAQEGGASWYAYNPGECAHQTIPKGTVVTVTNLATGASTTCVVTDRGPYGAGRIIDLDRSTFAQLADPSAGVIQVRITW